MLQRSTISWQWLQRMVKLGSAIRSRSSDRLGSRDRAPLTCGTTTWIWTHCSKRGRDWTTQNQLWHHGAPSNPGSVRTMQYSPKTAATKTTLWIWAQWVAFPTPAAAATPTGSVASATEMERLLKFIAPTISRTLTGAWLAPSSGSTAVHCAVLLGTMRTHGATVHWLGSRKKKGRRCNASSGEHLDGDVGSVTTVFACVRIDVQVRSSEHWTVMCFLCLLQLFLFFSFVVVDV